MTGTRCRLSVVAGLTAAVVLWIAPQASAAVTTSSITTPTDPTYALADGDSPNTISISGTSDGTTGDSVDIRCYLGTIPVSSQVSLGVAVQADGSFSATPVLPAMDQICRLRAVPAGTTPADLTPFSGPRLGAGERESFGISGGPNDGTVHDFYVWGQQLTAANDYDSYGSCGLCDGYLFDSNFTQTTVTFFRNDFFGRFNGSSTRSAVQVGTANSYASDQANDINPSAGNFPPLTWNVSQNASNGNLTISESERLVKCPVPTYPPDSTTCPSFVNTGVRVDRTITQEQDGHLVFITDRYVSTDGHDHPLDLLPTNEQFFSNSGPDIAYKFPGESAFSTRTIGNVSFPDSSPGAIYINVQGSTDGATDTGQGAIVFDRPASPAAFSDVDGNQLEFHQTGLATPSCSPSFSFAYAQDYDAADVQSLAQTALTRFNASPGKACSHTPPPTPPSTTPQSNPATGQRAAALQRCKRKHKKALKSKRAHDALTPSVKQHLKKKLRKCKQRANQLPV